MLEKAIQRLKLMCDSYHPLAEDDWKVFEAAFYPRKVRKGEILQNAGEVCKKCYFVSEGSIRTYHYKDGEEVHTAFHFEDNFVSDYESLTTEKPSQNEIVALEDSELLYFTSAEMMQVYEQCPKVPLLGRRIMESLLVKQQQYINLFLDHSPKERYLQILKDQPELIQRVPLTYLASYLGVARETLSRIRSRIV